jgi:hypothetical protein
MVNMLKHGDNAESGITAAPCCDDVTTKHYSCNTAESAIRFNNIPALGGEDGTCLLSQQHNYSWP